MSEELPLDGVGRRIRILITEDEPDLAKVFKMRFLADPSLRFEPRSASTLRETLEELAKGETDIVLLDLNLPDSGGYETFQRVHRSFQTVPVFIISANSDEELAIRAMRSGAQDYVVKGQVDGRMLPRLVRNAFERYCLDQRLEQLQKIEAMEMLAGGMVHDLGNLLLVIRGSADMLSRKLATHPEALELVQEIKKAGAEAAELTEKLLDFSRRQKFTPQVVDANQLARRLEAAVRGIAREGIRVAIEPNAEQSRINVDGLRLERCLMNLVINAIQAMPEGGTLTLRTENADVTRGAVESDAAIPEGSYLVFHVKDTGCGMTEEVKSHALEPFFTTKPRGKGTGLGLPSAYGMIKQAGGHLRMDSASGKGTTVTVFLPLVEESRQPLA